MEWSPDEDNDSVCACCGQDVVPEIERGYAFGEDQALCFSCALERGGVYSEHEDRWVRTPNLTGLLLPSERESFA